MVRSQQKGILAIRAFILVLFAAFAVVGYLNLRPEARAKFSNSGLDRRSPANFETGTDYSKFSHEIHQAMDIECSSCHKVPTANWNKIRDADTAFPDVTDFPTHDSCISCHREQFFKGRPPAICSICHKNPSPSDSSRFPFPNPREIYDKTERGKRSESKFEIYFPHATHVDLVSSRDGPSGKSANGARFVKARFSAIAESCAVCHSTHLPQGDADEEFYTDAPADLNGAFWLKKGTFMKSPINHANCFTCHSADTGIAPAPTDCATCHRDKQPFPRPDFDMEKAVKMKADKISLLAWRRRGSSGTFRHEFVAHSGMDCATCHDTERLSTIDPKTKKVPITSCGGCHITETLADGGILNAEIAERTKNPKFQCVKCHVSYGWLEIPESHLKAAEGGK